MRRAAIKALLTFSLLTIAALGLPNGSPELQPYPGTGMFLMLSDIHFDSYSDPTIMRQLGAEPLAACRTPAPATFSKIGIDDTNLPLLKSMLDEVKRTAREKHIHYDYVIVTGDFLAHNFDTRFQQCVGGGNDAFRQFATNTIAFVESMISKALPGVPVFAALGNNDSDRGDYTKPSEGFLQAVGQDWSQAWGNPSPASRRAALASFTKAGVYALPDPGASSHEFVVLNSTLWSAHNTQACSETDADPAGEFQWLAEVFGRVKREGRTATLIMHVPVGIDALPSSTGLPRELWTGPCTLKFIALLSEFRGTVREMYAGHIHRDDFRICSDQEGKPLAPIHIIPAVSPIYFDNPAVEIGWYDKGSGELRDYAAVNLDLARPTPAWTTEYVFSRAYGLAQADLASLESLSRQIQDARSIAGKHYAQYYAAGATGLLTPDNWDSYSCAQREITISRFAQCRRPAGH